MSQLNNNDNNEEIIGELEKTNIDENIELNIDNTPKLEEQKIEIKVKKSISGNKKSILFLSIFTVICIVITSIAIYLTLNNKIKPINLPDIKISTSNEDNLKIASLTERYTQNNIEVKQVEFTDGDLVVINEYYSYNTVEIYYDQISGLRDETLQNRINNEIKEKAFSIYDKKHLTDKNFIKIYITAKVTSNFSNVLSVYISGSIEYNNDDKVSVRYDNLPEMGLNYRLDNGEQLKFKDLFVSSANLNNIVANAEYKAFAWNEINEPAVIDMNEVDTSSYEDKVISVVNKFKQDDDIEFYFDPQYIFIKIDGVEEYIKIDMFDSYDSIAIYKRY